MNLFVKILKLTVFVSFFFIHELALGAESEEINQLLLQAERSRTANHTEFNSILEKLKPQFDEFSVNQKYYYLYLEGTRLAYQGDIEKAVGIYVHIKNNSQNTEQKYRASGALVNLYALTKNWLSGFEYLDFINSSHEAILNKDIRHQGLISAAIFYNELEQYEMTQSVVGRLLTEQVAGRNLCIALNAKLKADLFLEEFNTLKDDIFRAIETCQNANELSVINILRNNLAYYYLSIEDWNEVILLLEQYYQEIQDTNYQLLKIETDSLLAQAHFKLNNFSSAKKYAALVLDSDDQKSYSKVITSVYKILSTIAKKNKNFDIAMTYQDKYIKSYELYYQQSTAKQLAIESAKHRAKEKDNQINLLNKQNQILHLEKELSEEAIAHNRWLVALLALVVSVLIMWIVYVKRSQKKLKYLAEFDSLTRISNRAYFSQSAETILNYHSKTGRTASLVLFDLDHFKKINDNYGHPIGDKVLKLAANACKECVRKVDVFGRVGGEEFAILLPGCEMEQALRIAEECREKILQINYGQLGIDFEVTASFGVADSLASGYLLKDLVANADEAMYLAKRRGRNRVVQHSSSRHEVI